MIKVGDSIEWHGDFAIERRFIREPTGDLFWVLYKRSPTGLKIQPGALSAPAVVAAQSQYIAPIPKEFVQEPGRHPTHGDETMFEYVWVKLFEGPEAAVRTRLMEAIQHGF